MTPEKTKVAKSPRNVSMKPCLTITLVVMVFFLGFFCSDLRADKLKLVLLITIDQLRGDMPSNTRGRLGPGGFRYFFDHGTIYRNAHFNHLVTTTAAGHADLATGASTPGHGMAANEWYDRSARRKVYNTEDSEHPLLGVSAAPSEGRSPRKLLAATFGDVLVEANAGKSRVFSVSLKDRGAIIPAGRLGKAFWYSKYTGNFVTSTYYYSEIPGWMADWNKADHADRFREEHWTLLQDRELYVYRDQDNRYEQILQKAPPLAGVGDGRADHRLDGQWAVVQPVPDPGNPGRAPDGSGRAARSAAP